MRCIAKKGDAPGRPRRHRIAIEQSPFEDVLGLSEKIQNIRVPMWVSSQQLFATATDVPRFLDPSVCLSNRDYIYRPTRAHVIRDHVALRAQPERSVGTD